MPILPPVGGGIVEDGVGTVDRTENIQFSKANYEKNWYLSFSV